MTDARRQEAPSGKGYRKGSKGLSARAYSQHRTLHQHRRNRIMAKGTVKWFNDTKGFGFIEQEGGGEDVFVHHSAIEMDGYRSLKEGQPVEFELAQADKG